VSAYQYGKRAFDITIAGVVLLVTSPIIVLTSIAVRKKLGSPVLFRQPRPGLHGKVFEIAKFRTMTDERDASGALLADDIRLTRFGKVLRSTSIDELPELVNVLRGDMSLVGPRPLRVEYLDRYTPEQNRRHEVRPGITGLAQVSGRNNVPWDERFELDVQYVDSMSFRLDLQILLKTVTAIVKRDGISEEGNVTMTEFRG
jgi:sugar transferase EpsL